MISEEYRYQLAKLHSEKEDFGTSSPMYGPIIKAIAKQYKPEALLDYGCGKQALKTALNIKEGYIGYDPAIPGLDVLPDRCDFVVCTDVLEHIEPEYLDNVLDDLKRVTKLVGFFAVHTGKALNILPDGRNAHLIQEKIDWWFPKLISRFNLKTLENGENGFWVIVEPK